MNKALEELIEEITSSDEFIEYKRLEQLALNDHNLKSMIERLREVEKQAINAREFGLENAYNAYLKEYNEILKQFDENVLLSLYLTKKEEVKEMIDLATKIIENEIYKKIN